jgi:hypothetical protein
MQFQFYEPGKGLFKDLSAPDLLSTRHKPAVQKPQLISWVATSPTHLKRSTDAALSLADEDKRAVNPGDTLSCTKSTPVGIHVALSDATLQGQQIGSGWFIFPAHWQTQQMEEKRLLADAH